jgi:hypothetical protein
VGCIASREPIKASLDGTDDMLAVRAHLDDISVERLVAFLRAGMCGGKVVGRKARPRRASARTIQKSDTLIDAQ